MSITKTEIKKLRALLAKATPGPWVDTVSSASVHGDRDASGWSKIACSPCPASPEHSARQRQWRADAALIAAARNALPRLLDAYEAQAEEIERLRSAENLRLAPVAEGK